MSTVDSSQVEFARQQGFGDGVEEGKRRARAPFNTELFKAREAMMQTILNTRPTLDGAGCTALGDVLMVWIKGNDPTS